LWFYENRKDARRPYDRFGGGIAPRSLMCQKIKDSVFMTEAHLRKTFRGLRLFIFYLRIQNRHGQMLYTPHMICVFLCIYIYIHIIYIYIYIYMGRQDEATAKATSNNLPDMACRSESCLGAQHAVRAECSEAHSMQANLRK